MEAHRARRRFSQNFLHDRHVIERIVAAIDPRPGERVLEIGPGLGALTGQLIDAAGHLTAVEIDRDLAARLREHYRSEELTLIEADALEVDWAQLAAGPGAPLRIVGNLPYHISTPLLFAWVPVAARVADQHLMLQRELVDRIVAKPGGKDYGRLSVMLQFRYRVQRLFNVPPGSFTPAPTVQSSVIRMVPRPADELAVADVDAFGRVVASAFSQRRKTLRNALAALMDEAGIAGAGVDPGARAETLDVAAFGRLAAVHGSRAA